MTENTQTEEQQASSEKKSGSSLIIIVGIAVLLLLIGGGVMAFLLFGSGQNNPQVNNPEIDGRYDEAADLEKLAEDARKNPEKPPIFIELERFTSNLRVGAAGGPPGIAVVSFTLVVGKPRDQALIEARIPQIRHQVLRLLAARTFDELEHFDGKERLCEDILIEANRILHPSVAAALEMQLKSDDHTRAVTGHDVATDTSGRHDGGFSGYENRLSSARLQRLTQSLPIREVIYTNFLLQKL